MSPEQFVAKLKRGQIIVRAANEDAVRAIAESMRKQALIALYQATHGTRILRQAKATKSGVQTQLDVKTWVYTNGAVPYAIVGGRPAGMYSWLEKGTQRHFSGGGRNVKSVNLGSYEERRIQVMRENRRWNKEKGSYDYIQRMSYLRSQGRKLMAGNELSYGPIPHPGTDGKHIFSDAVDQVNAPKIAAKIIARHFVDNL